jgi:hypothetical protein
MAVHTLLARLGLRPEEEIARIGLNQRCLVGLEAAWACGAEVLVFDTLGTDCMGRQSLFKAVSAHLEQCPAIYLSYLYITQGRTERGCPPGARCIEIQRKAAPTAA